VSKLPLSDIAVSNAVELILGRSLFIASVSKKTGFGKGAAEFR
jgi:hypothetical protein